jgi:hypothetical protein
VTTDVYVETGPKKVFACALEWPGWARSGKTEDDALQTLAEYAARYRPVAERAGVRFPKSAGDDRRVGERVEGSSSTDFGVPAALDVRADQRALTKASAGRLAELVEASLAYFDDVARQAPATLRKGPRGGGRDRDAIVDHVRDAVAAYGNKIGVRPVTRDALLDALRAARQPMPESTATGKSTPWPYRYAARRIAWHALDHAWEIEDKTP